MFCFPVWFWEAGAVITHRAEAVRFIADKARYSTAVIAFKDNDNIDYICKTQLSERQDSAKGHTDLSSYFRYNHLHTEMKHTLILEAKFAFTFSINIPENPDIKVCTL